MMKPMIFLIAAALLGAGIVAGTAALAQPVSEMHQQSDQTPDANGMFPARSTKGHFSVIMPVQFNDFTVRTPDKNIGELVMHMIGAKTSDGFEITAYEMERGPRQKDPDLMAMVGGIAKIVGTTAPDLPVQTEGDATFVETVLTGTTQTAHYKVSKTQSGVFAAMCLYRNGDATVTAASNQLCSDFVASFRVVP